VSDFERPSPLALGKAKAQRPTKKSEGRIGRRTGSDLYASKSAAAQAKILIFERFLRICDAAPSQFCKNNCRKFHKMMLTGSSEIEKPAKQLKGNSIK
jgi:hypothetical protein